MGHSTGSGKPSQRSDIARRLYNSGQISQSTYGQLATYSMSNEGIDIALERGWISETIAARLREGTTLPRGIAPNSRLGRNWMDADRGDADFVVRDYDRLIRAETDRLRRLKNGFARQAAQQEIDRLKDEQRRIREFFLD